MRASSVSIAVLLLAGAGIGAHLTSAQRPAGVTRTHALQHDLDIADRQVIQERVDFAPGASFGNHTHPGAEIAYVLEGTLEYRLADRPPVTRTAGEALFIPAGTVHSARNAGSTKASELATYLVEKGRPLLVRTPPASRGGTVRDATELAAHRK